MAISCANTGAVIGVLLLAVALFAPPVAGNAACSQEPQIDTEEDCVKLAACEWADERFSCFPKAVPGKACKDYTFDTCPASCDIPDGTDTCVARKCSDFFDTDACTSYTEADCSFDTDAFVCYPTGTPPGCKAYSVSASACPTKKEDGVDCEYDSDLDVCYKKGSGPDCDQLISNTDCGKVDTCEWSSAASVCVPKGTKPDCEFITTFASCMADTRCCYDEVCVDVSEVTSCDRTVKPCTEYSAEDCIPGCYRDGDSCRDPYCREIFEASTCNSNSDCEYKTVSCYPKDTDPDASCESISFENCPARCSLDFGGGGGELATGDTTTTEAGSGATAKCVDRQCFENTDQTSCENSVRECNWIADQSFCSDPNEPTEPPKNCSLYVDTGDCFEQGCVECLNADDELVDCVNIGAVCEVTEPPQSTTEPLPETCEEALSFGVCNRSSLCVWEGDKCNTRSCDQLTKDIDCYQSEDCVYANNKCRDKKCVDFFTLETCPSACSWSNLTNFQVCSEPDVGGACGTFDETECPRPRCNLDYSNANEGNNYLPECVATTCRSFTSASSCRDAPASLACQFTAGVCFGEDEELSCSDLQTPETCQSRNETCNWENTIFRCLDKDEEIPCNLYNGLQAPCIANEKCAYFSQIAQCFNAPGPNCTAILSVNAEFCRETENCQFDEDNDKCIDCPEGLGNCRYIPPSPPHDCEERSSLNCTLNELCIIGSQGCEERSCSQMFSEFGCLYNINNCTYDEDTAICRINIPDDIACADLENFERCAGAPDRCSWSFNDDLGESLCTDAGCKDFFTKDGCESFDGADCTFLEVDSVCYDAVNDDPPCDRMSSKEGCDELPRSCAYDDKATACHAIGDPPACDRYFPQNNCPSDRCEWYNTISSCLPAGSEPPCESFSFFPESACAAQDHCKYVVGGFYCTDKDDVVPCSRITAEVPCNFKEGCSYNNGTCVDCSPGEPGCTEPEVPACDSLSQANCNLDYCVRENTTCVDAPCRNVASQNRAYCTVDRGCRYDPYRRQCVEVDDVPTCISLAVSEVACLNAREGCEWIGNYSVCVDEGDPVPCSYISQRDDCLAQDQCTFQFGICFDKPDTTTGPDTTTTLPDICATRPCHRLTECVQGDEPNEFSCTPCPPGYAGSGLEGCRLVSCSSNIPGLDPNAGIDGLLCINNGYNETCTASCGSGYEQTGSGIFTCDDNGQWQGSLTCSDIKECEADPSPCDDMVTCTELDGGGYKCGECPDGYETNDDGATCVDIDECKIPGFCDSQQKDCTNTPGSYDCGDCASGYNRTAPNECDDIDECAVNPDACSPRVDCFNRQGTFFCGSCPSGFDGDGVGPDGCRPKDCGSVISNIDENAMYDCSNSTTLNSKCSVACKPGFSSSTAGGAEYTCTPSGQWVGFISCREVPCSNPSGSQLPDGAQTPQCALKKTCDLRCEAGYAAKGTPQLLCQAASWVKADPDFECRACDGVTEYQDSPGRSRCKSVTPVCGANFYESKAPTATSDRECMPVTDCPELTPPTATSDRVCRECSPCASNQYIMTECDSVSDTVCAPCTACEYPQYPREECAGKQDAVCAQCSMGQYGEAGQPCQDWTVCNVGQAERSLPTLTVNRRCGAMRSDSKPPQGRIFVRGSVLLEGDTDLTAAEQNVLFEGLRRHYGAADALIGLTSVRAQSDRRRATGVLVSYRIELPASSRSAATGKAKDSAGLTTQLVAAQGDLTFDEPPTDTPAASSASLGSVESAEGEQDTAKDGGSDSSMIPIIAGAAGGVIVIIIVVFCLCTRKSKGADISGGSSGKGGADNFEANYADMHEMMALKTLETTAKAPTATRATRQSSFYSSIQKASSEV